MLRRLVVVVLAACAATLASAQANGSATAEPVVATVRPAAEVTSTGTASIEIDDGMRTILQKVGSVPCSEHVRSRMYLLLFENNRQLHDQCFIYCGYQFFPASKDKATPEQIVAAATSKACLTLFSGVILANFPECDVDFVSTRSCAEILMRVKKDIDEKQAVPTQRQFYELYNLNRVVNLLNENATLVEAAFRETTTKITVWEMTKMMNRIYVSPDVKLLENMTILVRDDATETTTTSSVWREANVALSLTDPSDASDEQEETSTPGVAIPSSTYSDSGSAEEDAPTTYELAPTPSPTATAIQETTRSSNATPSRAMSSLWPSLVVGWAVAMCVFV